MPNIMERLSALFKIAIDAAFPDIPGLPADVTLSQNDKFGDYQCNSSMNISGVGLYFQIK